MMVIINENITQTNIWYHGSPADILNWGDQPRGNQVPYGVHFTQDIDVAKDFASGATKYKPTGNKGYLYKAAINTDKALDVTSSFLFREGTALFDVLDAIGKRGRVKHYVRNYSPKYGRYVLKSEEDTIKAIDVSILDSVKHHVMAAMLQKYGYSLMVKYMMGGKASPFSPLITYEEEALAVLSESAIQSIEKINLNE